MQHIHALGHCSPIKDACQTVVGVTVLHLRFCTAVAYLFFLDSWIALQSYFRKSFRIKDS